MKWQPAVLMVAGSLVACVGPPPAVRPPLVEDGEIHVYMKPWPPVARELRMRLEGIAARAEDGGSTPLTPVLTDLDGASVDRPRLLASGTLPRGRYAGLELRTGPSSNSRHEEGAARRPPAEPVAITIPFTILPRRAVVVTVEMLHGPSIDEAPDLEPVFTAAVPSKLATGLIGIVSCRAGNALFLFDKVSGHVVAAIPTGRAPAGMALDTERNRVYVAASGEDAIEAVDLLEDAVIGRLSLRAGDEPLRLALTPDRRTLLAANTGSGTVSLIDVPALFERDRVQVGSGPESVVPDRGGTLAYVLNATSNTITVLGLPSGRVVATIATDPGPFLAQFNRDGTRLFVAQRDSPYLDIVALPSLSIERRLYVGPGTTALKVDPRTDRIYVARRGSDVLDVYDPVALLPADTVRMEADVGFLAIDDEGNNLCTVLTRMNQLHLVRLVGKKVVARVDVGEEPYEATFLG